jgi:mono/diheme cytochrome c family protein
MDRMAIASRAMAAMCVFALVAGCLTAGARATAGDGQAAGAAPAANAELQAALVAEGGGVYDINCAECHAAGGAGADITNDPRLAKAEAVITRILLGSANGDMPEFGSTLSDREIAAVATFVRNSFENAFGVVLEADVTRIRAEEAAKK